MPAYDRSTALIVIDVRNDFADPRGSLYVTGSEVVIESINEAIAAARTARALVVYTQDWHPPQTPHFETDGGIWPPHCLQTTCGAEFHPRLDTGEPIVRKGVAGEDGYSAFSVRDVPSGTRRDTELDRLLRDQGIQRVIIVGLATDYCVKATALDAVHRGFETAVPQHAVRAVDLNDGDSDRALQELRLAGVTVTA